MAEDAQVGNKTSFTIRSAENLLASVDIVEDTENDESDGSNNKTVKRLSLSKMPNVPTRYFTSLCSKKRWVSLDSFGYSWGSLLKVLSEWLQVKFAATTN